MTKRSFFKSIASIVATVALAPEIAFGAKLDLPVKTRRELVFEAFDAVVEEWERIQAEELAMAS